MYYIVGLGNPGEEYDNTRHNAGRMTAQLFAKLNKFDNFEYDKVCKAQRTEGKLGKEKVTVILPDTFMNKSGESLLKLKDLKGKVKDKKKSIENLIVIHDDLDIPLGKMKVSWNKSSGGHRGVESIIKVVKTEAFVRVRIGISPTTSSGKMKKPVGEEVVGNFILAKFKPAEDAVLRQVFKRATEAIASVIGDGKDKAMSVFNS